MNTIKKITGDLIKAKAFPEEKIKRKLNSLLKNKKTFLCLIEHEVFKWSGRASVEKIIKPFPNSLYYSKDLKFNNPFKVDSDFEEKSEKNKGTIILNVKNFNDEYDDIEFTLSINEYKKSWWAVIDGT